MCLEEESSFGSDFAPCPFLSKNLPDLQVEEGRLLAEDHLHPQTVQRIIYNGQTYKEGRNQSVWPLDSWPKEPKLTRWTVPNSWKVWNPLRSQPEKGDKKNRD